MLIPFTQHPARSVPEYNSRLKYVSKGTNNDCRRISQQLPMNGSHPQRRVGCELVLTSGVAWFGDQGL